MEGFGSRNVVARMAAANEENGNVQYPEEGAAGAGPSLLPEACMGAGGDEL